MCTPTTPLSGISEARTGALCQAIAVARFEYYRVYVTFSGHATAAQGLGAGWSCRRVAGWIEGEYDGAGTARFQGKLSSHLRLHDQARHRKGIHQAVRGVRLLGRQPDA